MRKLKALLIVLALLATATSACARGQAADDCPAGSKDPDCAGASSHGN